MVLFENCIYMQPLKPGNDNTDVKPQNKDIQNIQTYI